MKKIKFIIITTLIALFAISCCPNSVVGQITKKTTPLVYNLDVNKLSPQARAEIEQQTQANQITQQLEQYGEWAGMGQEVGIAVREALTAVVDVSERFGNTRVGAITIGLVIWKVVGKDVVRMSLGIILIMITLIFVAKSYFKTFNTRRITSRTGWWIFGKREYEIVESNKFWKYPNSAALFHVVVMLAMWGISAAIMFS